MQMVFQDSYASLNPRLTIEESIAFGPKVHGMADDASRALARELLGKVGLRPENFANRYPHEISGGQRQRVNIARALALSPRLVILDEAVSALDKSVEAQVLNLLVDLKREFGLTYLFISHDLNVVRYISDRVLVMYLGEVVELGPVDRVWDAPAHPYTQGAAGGDAVVRSGQPHRNAADLGRSAQSDRSALGLPVSHPMSLSRSRSAQMPRQNSPRSIQWAMKRRATWPFQAPGTAAHQSGEWKRHDKTHSETDQGDERSRRVCPSSDDVAARIANSIGPAFEGFAPVSGTLPFDLEPATFLLAQKVSK